MRRLRISLPGTPEVVLNGEPVHISRRKAVALLAYLAVTGQRHTRDAVAATVEGAIGESALVSQDFPV